MSSNMQLLPEHQDLPKREIYPIGVAAALLGVSVKTLQRWDNSGHFKAFRSGTDRRYYTRDLLKEFIDSGRFKPKRGHSPKIGRVEL